MIFGLKDLIYICVYVASMVAIFEAVKHRLSKVEESNVKINKAIFMETGGLNVVNNDTCQDRRETINKRITREVETANEKIEREADITRRAFQKIDRLDKNIVEIMMSMKLKPIVVETKKRD